jgi:xylose isomerase
MVTATGWNGFTSLLNDAQRYLYTGAADNVSARMRAARAAGLSAIRIWGHGDGVDTLLQTDAGA